MNTLEVKLMSNWIVPCVECNVINDEGKVMNLCIIILNLSWYSNSTYDLFFIKKETRKKRKKRKHINIHIHIYVEREKWTEWRGGPSHLWSQTRSIPCGRGPLWGVGMLASRGHYAMSLVEMGSLRAHAPGTDMAFMAINSH